MPTIKSRKKIVNSQSIRKFVGDRARNSPRVYEYLKDVENRVERCRHTVGRFAPGLIQPKPYKIMVAVTADCNARCHGCRYGRDFMPGRRLSWEMVRELLDDAAEAGFYAIRFYGGEPLLHSDLPSMVKYCAELGMRPYVTTNGLLLAKKIDALVEAGLRDITFGFYGIGDPYDEYTQRKGMFAQVERGIAKTAEKYAGLVQMQMNWLLMKPTASVKELLDATEFAERYGMVMRVDLIHYSLPYFQEGHDRFLQFTPADRPVIERVVEELIAVKREKPELLHHTIEGLRSIPDWLIKGPAMQIPCTAYEMIWVGADGTVQMCYVTFPLGNLNEKRLSDLLFTKTHRCAAQDAFKLNCPNCHCSSNERIMRHAPSVRHYNNQAWPC